MKYLHIIPQSTRMMRGFLEMIETHFDSSEHEFVTYTRVLSSESGLFFCKNMHNITTMGHGKIGKFLALHKLFKQAEHLIFHCFQPNWMWLIFTWLHRAQLRNGAWVIWGIDLYNAYKPGKGLLTKLYNRLLKDCLECFGTAVVMCETDIAVYQKMFGDRPVYVGAYPLVESHFEQMDRIIQEKKQQAAHSDEEPHLLQVQVGHNAFSFNRHVDALKKIQKFRNMPMHIYMPMAYGDQPFKSSNSYVSAVESYCRMYLDKPDLVYIQTEMLPPSEYKQVLSSIDVAILNANRQNALGNIMQLLYMGKKVFLAADNPLLPYFRSHGVLIHDVTEIDHMTFEEFAAPDDEPYPNPWIKENWGMEHTSADWAIVFQHIDCEVI